MRFAAVVCALSLAAGATAAPLIEAPSVADGALSKGASSQDIWNKAQKTYRDNTRKQLSTNGGYGKCTEDKLMVRKAWGALSKKERKSYLSAVKCLTTKPTTLDLKQVPGARNRRDDFAWSHMNQTNYIHNSGLLLPWHRQFVWAYDQALRNLCGYRGPTPYWDYEATSNDPATNAVWDGSETSFGGNGKAIPHAPLNATLVDVPLEGFFILRPAGTGGGVIEKTGGLGDYRINLGPVTLANNTPDNKYGTHYNPRRLTRDFLPDVSKANLTVDAIAQLIQMPDIRAFHPHIEFHLHPDSHLFVGGDLFDLYSSPNDPVFFLLHAQIDRFWTVWQGLDAQSRTTALDGTVTFANAPPSPNATLSTVMKMGIAGGDVPIRAAMSATAGQYCYIYE